MVPYMGTFYYGANNFETPVLKECIQKQMYVFREIRSRGLKLISII